MRSDWDNDKTLFIDEVSYKKRNHYFTIINYHTSDKIIEIIEGIAYKNVSEFLKKIKRRIRLKIKWISVYLCLC